MLTFAGGGLHVAVTRKLDALIILVTVALGLASTPVLTQLPQSLSSAQAQRLLLTLRRLFSSRTETAFWIVFLSNLWSLIIYNSVSA